MLTDEQRMLRDSAASWVRERAPVAAFRKLRNSRSPLGYDPKLYAEMAEMGWAGVVVPEAFGGSEFGYRSLGIILEELGRNLVASPIVCSGLAAATALRLAGTQAQKERWLPAIAAGKLIATLATDEERGHAPARIALSAKRTTKGWLLSGEKRPVPEAMAAGLVIVAARSAGAPGDENGLTLFIVDTASPGLTRMALDQIDSRGAAILTFADVEVGADAVLGSVDHGGALLDQVLDRARAGLAAEMLGTATQAFETTLDYLKTRMQFGRTIGSFQALQHRAAALEGELELTRSAVEAALTAIDAGEPDIAPLAAIAKAMAGETLRRVVNEMIQMHGGIGMTDEHDAGLFLKRARVADACYGNAAFHRERFGRLTGY